MKKQTENSLENKRKTWCKPVTDIIAVKAEGAGILYGSDMSAMLPQLEDGGELEEEEW